jgi:tRNA nucleotidyltransferase (CCA-adding enzyme)
VSSRRRAPRSKWRSSPPGHSSRSRRSRTSEETLEDYVRSLELDAYVVGGAVRDELLGRESKDADFLVPGVDTEELKRRLAPHGRVEDLVVAGRLVGVRLLPADKRVRRYARSGIEFAPPRKEVSTGPGRHDFEIVADPSLSVEEDMRRRDFTINAIAKRLSTGELVDPLDGRKDLERRVLRTVSPTSFAEDPLRLVRALRFVAQLGFDPDEQTLQQMHDEASSVRLVSGERIGGGLAADGMGELSKLLLGDEPRKALRLARDTGVLAEVIPEFARAIGFDQESRYHDLTVDEHTFAVVQAAADAHRALPVRLAALFHDIGKPYVAWRGTDGRLHYYAKPGYAEQSHEQVSAQVAGDALRRLRYPNALRERVCRIVRHHMFQVGKGDAVRARRFLAKHGDELAFQLLDHKEADFLGKRGSDGPPPLDDLDKLARFRGVLEREQRQPHRLKDLAVDGSDLIELGYKPGPGLGRALQELLRDVVDEPERNTRETLLERARERLRA